MRSEACLFLSMALMSSRVTVSFENRPPCTTSTRLFSKCARGSQQKVSLKKFAINVLCLAFTYMKKVHIGEPVFSTAESDFQQSIPPKKAGP